MNATKEMKQGYEEMKKDAQLEEYNFMETVMNHFKYHEIEQKIRNMFEEI